MSDRPQPFKSDIEITTIPPNRLKDLLTPQGFSEKGRLTCGFVSSSLSLYEQTRRRLREALRPATVGSLKGIALYGTGEAAELDPTLKEIGPDPMGRKA